MREREKQRQVKREANRKMLRYLVETGRVGGNWQRLTTLEITLLIKGFGYEWVYPPGEWVLTRY